MNPFVYILGGAITAVVIGSLIACRGSAASPAYRQGYRDYTDRQYLNPHPHNTKEYADWMEGQMAAFTDSSPWV